MKKITIFATSVAALLATSAMAQQAPTSTAPAARAPAETSTPAPTSQMPASQASFIQMKSADQHMASDLIGMSVRGPADESIGEIDDLVLTADGRAVGAVIGVGGFLGVGEKDVAVPFQMVQLVGAPDDLHAKLSKTKDELKAAPAFEEEPVTTGSIPAPRTTAPAPAN